MKRAYFRMEGGSGAHDQSQRRPRYLLQATFLIGCKYCQFRANVIKLLSFFSVEL